MSTKKSDARIASARALAAAAFGIAAPLAYLGQRLYERARTGVVDPTMILRDSHTGLYWRACTALWWAGIAAVLVFAWAARANPGDGPARWLRRGVVPFVLVVVALAWRFA